MEKFKNWFRGFFDAVKLTGDESRISVLQEVENELAKVPDAPEPIRPIDKKDNAPWKIYPDNPPQNPPYPPGVGPTVVMYGVLPAYYKPMWTADDITSFIKFHGRGEGCDNK